MGRGGFSRALGIVSVLTWGVAEVPQIVTNYKNKSAAGLSLAFLGTWIVGDLFNLSGCLLEPATLPTQLYTAVLYLLTTLALCTQTVYYNYVYPRLTSNRRMVEAMQAGHDEKSSKHAYSVDAEKASIIERLGGDSPSSPIPFPSSSASTSEDMFFMSARSLSMSHTPPVGSYPAPRTPTSDIEHHSSTQPLLDECSSVRSAPPPKIKTMLCVVSLTLFFLGTCNHQLLQTHKNDMIFRSPKRGMVLQVGRGLLEAKATNGSTQGTSAAEGSGFGSYLGWGMAVIYLGGRLPQIHDNMKRGNAEGLNPLMFIFAIIGNATYVASILVNSLEWSKVKINIPWLVDAMGCVLLDCFILLQFIHFRRRSRRAARTYVS